MNNIIPSKLKQIVENILATNEPDKLKIYFNEYLCEYEKINFNPSLIEGKNLNLKILNESFKQHYQNCIDESQNRFDTKDLVISFAIAADFIKMNNLE